ncbi:hypothetical protein KP509_07G005400 [Ceratopteris richardii]|uniref:Autophagy-related protein 13 N-terminal domain-containing protein n=1 Tax=Ceratopteris richardii TaxID=49495 RepID=A0A8T2U749_CERRI|nr:hypothetical protein KP509_07G005400 [Ceratopteris richardii]
MAGSEKSPELKTLVTQFYGKALEVILESRFQKGSSPSNAIAAPSQPVQHCKSSFKIVTGQFGPEAEKINPWSKGICKPMVIDVLYMTKRQKNMTVEKSVASTNPSKEVSEDYVLTQQGILLERWTVELVKQNVHRLENSGEESGIIIVGHYLDEAQSNKCRVPRLKSSQQVGTSEKDVDEAIRASLEKNLTILLRSLYSAARLLPGQNLSRMLRIQSRHKPRLYCRIRMIPPPLSVTDKKCMKQFCFPSVDIGCGHLHISAAYRKDVTFKEQKRFAGPPLIITDYVSKLERCERKESAIGHAHSLPSTFCTSSFKPNGLGSEPAETKELSLKRMQSWAFVQPLDAPMGTEDFDLPFAIDHAVYDRMGSGGLLTSDFDFCARNHQEGDSLGSLLSMLKPPYYLNEAKEHSSVFHKTADDALKELSLYIDFKDKIRTNCT